MTTASVSSTSETGKGSALTPADTRTRMERFAPHLPYETFPLTPHPSGRWCKKHKGVQFYYGKLSDGWEKALAAFEKFWPYDSGGKARPTDDAVGEGLTVKLLCDHFYESKRQLHAAGEITARSLADYDATCTNITKAFHKHRLVTDLDARDFAALRKALTEKQNGKPRSPAAVANEINRCRMVFGFAFKNGLIDRPVRFGTSFDRPSKKTLRIARAEKGPMTLEPVQIRQLISIADVQMKAMILLGINCGMGNQDVADLQFSHLDLDKGIIDYPRPKTGIARRAMLWPETGKALREAIANRYQPGNEADAGCVFITKYRNRWADGTRDNPVSKSFTLLLNDLKFKRKGLSFYALRHVYRTIADETGDHRAIDRTMGHESGHISTAYVERIDDARLKKIADHVHQWLYAKPVKAKGGGKAQPAAKPAKPVTDSKPQHTLRIAG